MTAPPPFGATVPGNAWDLVGDAGAPRRSVSVVITHFEQPDELARTLSCLRRQTIPIHQIVVADDGSRTPPRPDVDVEVVTHPDRGFRAAAVRNLAVRRCTGDVLVFLDADTAPEPAYVERLSRLPGLLPELLAVGRRRHARLSLAPVDAPVGEIGPRRELAEPAWLRTGLAQTCNLRHIDATSYRFVLSAVLACSRWWFDEIGGFDDSFVGYGGEDWELAHRSHLHGGLLAHVPAAVAWHDGPAVGEEGRQQTVDAADGAVDDGLRQTLALADRAGTPGATYRGLLLGPPDLVVTADPSMDRKGLTLSLDSVLAALPRCRVVLPRARARWFEADPRVVVGPDHGTSDPQSWTGSRCRLQLHLTAPAVGPASAWQRLVDLASDADSPATHVVRATDGSRLGVLHDLRQHRRAERWRPVPGVDLAIAESDATVGLTAAADLSLQAWLEGW